MALSADSPMKIIVGERQHYPVAASTKIYEGAMVGDNAAGYARGLVAGDEFRGHAVKQADNSSGSAGDINVEVLTGRYRLEVSLAGSITDVGSPVYASADGTLTFAPVGNSYVGVVTRYVSSSVLEVEFRPGEQDEFGSAYRLNKTDNFNAAATETGTVYYLGVDGKTATLPATAVGLKFTVVNSAADGTAGIAVEFQAADKNLGGCGFDAGADGKKLTNTKATAKRGDYLTLVADGKDGYRIEAYRGTWAQES